MNSLKKILSTISKHTIVVIVFCGVLAYFAPQMFMWVKGTAQNLLLGFIIFSMGLSIKGTDIKNTIKAPWYIILGIVLQFTIMPISALLLTTIFNFETGIKIGLVLVACVPGAAASNIMTYIAKGDVALSIAITMATSMLSPIITPLIVYWMLNTTVVVDVWAMSKSILLVVLLPLTLGIVIRRFFKEKTLDCVMIATPSLAVIGLGFIVGGAVAQQGDKFFSGGWALVLGATALNLLGYLGGWIVTRVIRVPRDKCCTIAIEAGMQNCGLATTLASLYFANFPTAIALSAFSCAWYAVTGAIIAKVFLKKGRQ